MINLYLLEKLSRELNIAPLNIIRENLEMEVLYYLSRSGLSENIIFYGGTALRLAYKSLRFSEDLDFLFVKQTASAEQELKQILNLVTEKNKEAALEEVRDKRHTLFGLLHIKGEFLKHPVRIKIEISKRKNGVKSENLLLMSPTSAKEPIIKTATLESLKRMKTRAIRNRNLPRDWFDYWYVCQKLSSPKTIRRKLPFNPTEFRRELRRWLPRSSWKIIDTVMTFFS